MKFIHIFFIYLILNSCNNETIRKITIDLSQENSKIYYTDFVDSVSLMTLYTTDSCMISKVQNLYTDGPYTILLDKGGSGVCIFFNNRLISNIADYGRGPQEFINITSFCLDKLNKNICIYDDRSEKILKYKYDGSFICEFPYKDLIRDFANINGQFVMIQPSYLRKMRSGIWIADSIGQYVKTSVKENQNNKFEALYPHNFNFGNEGISYYDRYENQVLYITPDSIQIKYRFNLIPELPASLKKDENGHLNNYFMLASFYDFKKYILLYYGSDKEFYQVLFNKTDSTYKVTEHIIDDITGSPVTPISELYIDEHKMALELPAKEDDYNIHFQILHITQ